MKTNTDMNQLPPSNSPQREENRFLKHWERWGVIALILLAWSLRWVTLLEVPPGWRDDDLIEIYTFSREILHSGPRLYFSGASGHEPLYHTLRAPLIAVAGINIASARWLAATCGTLAVLLTWAVGRRLFGCKVGLLAGALVAVSFWSLMYSRLAIRHIATLPSALIAIYWGWRQLQGPSPPKAAPLGIALGTGAAVMTYYAGRLVPAMLLVALPVVGWQRKRWKAYVLGLAGGLLLAVPMFWAASNASGADARIDELAVPLQALWEGNLEPLLETTLTTLGMFHSTGDPEWLYNIPGRPVFGWLGAAFFYLGIIIALAHLKKPSSRLLLLWAATGIAPAFISLPPASLGHTILALPAVYLITALPTQASAKYRAWFALPIMFLTLTAVTARDLPDYFVHWPQKSMVRFLYRADYRALARHLNTHPSITDASVGGFLYGYWDRVALETDLSGNFSERQDVAVRWSNPERALVGRKEALPFYAQEAQHPHPAFEAWLASAPPLTTSLTLGHISTGHMSAGIALTLPEPPPNATAQTNDGLPLVAQSFANALVLHAVAWDPPPTPGREARSAMWWEVVGPLPLPPETLIPHPPPPGVYSGPRLKVFAHLLAPDGTLLAGDDGLWVDPYTLHTGDRFIQWHHFTLDNNAATGPYTLVLGLYDPMTGERWPIPGDAGTPKDKLMLSVRP